MIPTREEIDNEYHYKIYILESPSIKDISEKRNEGDSLFAALKLCNIDCMYLDCNSRESLIESTNKIADDINNRLNNKIPMPYLHFSMHGNEDAVALSNGEIVTWIDLRSILMQLNNKVRFAKFDEKIVSRFSISMSVCKGIYALKMYMPSESLNPFWSLVGPISSINWADSLTAFIVFYHSLIYKRTFITEAIIRMNSAVGSNDFKNFLDTRFIHITEK
jgi:hypothetical protein